MKLLVEVENTLSEIESQFTQLFPKLKLQFIATLANETTGNPGMDLKELGDLHISELAMQNELIAILIEPEMTAEKVKEAFAKHYQFEIRISMKSGDQYVEIAAGSDESLENLNAKAS